MDDAPTAWRPTQAEVAAIVESLKPLIARLARRDQAELAKEIVRRRRARERVAAA